VWSPGRVEDGSVIEHEEGGAGQSNGNDGVGLELVAVHAGLQALGQGLEPVVIAFGDDGGFAESPAEIGVAEFGAAQALDLAGAGHRAFDQAAVGKEVFGGGINIGGGIRLERSRWASFSESMRSFLFLPP